MKLIKVLKIILALIIILNVKKTEQNKIICKQIKFLKTQQKIQETLRLQYAIFDHPINLDK